MVREGMHTKFLWRNLLKHIHIEDREENWGYNISWILGRYVARIGGGWWIELAQNRVQWQALVLVVLNLLVLLPQC
jgi:hypothetical protein